MPNSALEVKPETKKRKKRVYTILGVDLRGLTPKKRKFLRKYAETLNPTEAALHASPTMTKKSAETLGSRWLQEVSVSLDEILKLHGIDDRAIATTFANGLRAKKVELGRFEGKFTDQRDFPDHAVRKSYLELLLKATGRLSDGTTINQFIDARKFKGEDSGDYIRRTLAEVPSG